MWIGPSASSGSVLPENVVKMLQVECNRKKSKTVEDVIDPARAPCFAAAEHSAVFIGFSCDTIGRYQGENP